MPLVPAGANPEHRRGHDPLPVPEKSTSLIVAQKWPTVGESIPVERDRRPPRSGVSASTERFYHSAGHQEAHCPFAPSGLPGEDVIKRPYP